VYRDIEVAPFPGEDGRSMQPAAALSTPCLVLLPGLDGTGKLFVDFIEALGTGIDARIVTYPLDQRLGYEPLEDRVRAALPTSAPFVLLAESFSGPIAIRIAAEPPAGLAGVILCVTFARNPFPRLAWLRPLVTALPIKSMPRWVRSVFLWGPRSSQRIPSPANRATAAVDADVLRHRIGAMLGVDATPALRRVAIPLLVVEATSDNVVPATATADILRLQPHARHVRIEGPHLLMQTCPRECAAVVTAFLHDVSGSPPRPPGCRHCIGV
jgi:pimeloyl-ACP methyl ester carboxylesterase